MIISPAKLAHICMLSGVAMGAVGSLGCSEDSCEGARDEESPDAPLEIRVENHRSSPIFLVSDEGCSSTVPLVIADASGPVPWTREDRLTCEDLMTGGCVQAASAALCALPPTIRIEPGGAYPITWDKRVYAAVDMPQSCFARPEECAGPCAQRVPTQAGDYDFSIEIASGDAVCTDPESDGCLCSPNADGWCEVSGPELPSKTEMLTTRGAIPDAATVSIVAD